MLFHRIIRLTSMPWPGIHISATYLSYLYFPILRAQFNLFCFFFTMSLNWKMFWMLFIVFYKSLNMMYFIHDRLYCNWLEYLGNLVKTRHLPYLFIANIIEKVTSFSFFEASVYNFWYSSYWSRMLKKWIRLIVTFIYYLLCIF